MRLALTMFMVMFFNQSLFAKPTYAEKLIADVETKEDLARRDVLEKDLSEMKKNMEIADGKLQNKKEMLKPLLVKVIKDMQHSQYQDAYKHLLAVLNDEKSRQDFYMSIDDDDLYISYGVNGVIKPVHLESIKQGFALRVEAAWHLRSVPKIDTIELFEIVDNPDFTNHRTVYKFVADENTKFPESAITYKDDDQELLLHLNEGYVKSVFVKQEELRRVSERIGRNNLILGVPDIQ